MITLQARVDLGAMAMKGYSTFPKAPALREPHNQIIQCHIRRGGIPTPQQLVYSTAPTDWAVRNGISN